MMACHSAAQEQFEVVHGALKPTGPLFEHSGIRITLLTRFPKLLECWQMLAKKIEFQEWNTTDKSIKWEREVLGGS